MNTKQQEFDIVVEHLFKQGRPARQSNGATCKYRHKTEDGSALSCAVGCRIPDSRYSKNMEGNSHAMLVEKFGHRLRKELTAYKYMFIDLQNVHDNTYDNGGSFNIKDLTARLKYIAKVHDLVFTVPVKEG